MDRLRDSPLMRSGLLTALLMAAVLLVFGGVWAAHMRGRIHRLRVIPVAPDTVQVPRPGGQEIASLTRSPRASSVTPEFVSASLLPGIGMEVLQISVNLPNRGELPLLLSTPVNDLIAAGKRAQTSPFQVLIDGRAGPRRSTVNALGQRAADRAGPRRSTVNALGQRAADRADDNTMPDGGEAIAYFYPTVTAADGTVSEDGVEVRISTLLSGRAVDITMTAKNVSNTPRGIALAWQPRFAVPDSGIGHFSLILPSSDQTDDARSASATSKSRLGSRITLGTRDYDVTLAHLKRSFFSSGPEAQLRNLESGYTLHLTALSTSIRGLHFQADRGGKSVLLAFSTSTGDDDPRTLIGPGESMQWKVRMEVTASPTYLPTQPEPAAE